MLLKAAWIYVVIFKKRKKIKQVQR